MPKTLVALPQITPPPTLNSNAALLTNISRFNALNPEEKLALRVYFLATELANQATNPITTYNPTVSGATEKLVQDAQTVYGTIPTCDLETAALVIDWANAKAVFGGLSSDVDTLRQLVLHMAARSNDELNRIILYLRQEMGK